MPLFTVIFFIFTLANLGFPGTANFVPEMMIFQSIYSTNMLVSIFCLWSLFFTAIFGFWIFTRVTMGNYSLVYKNNNIPIKFYADLSKREFLILLWPLFLIILFGIKPQLLINFCIYSLLELSYL
jgi:NADH-quinone oxidoreductase subunit M